MTDAISVETDGDWAVSDWIAVAAVTAIVIAIASLLRTNVIGWGDDFALYVMQAKAIGTGSMRAEVLLNSHILTLSDAPVGPPAVPWGFPVLL